MPYPMSYSNSKLNKVMTQEQFDLVVEAILAGKYSWACVLILRFGGYNPLHYIPYRTYNRLMKQQRQGVTESGHRSNESTSANPKEQDLPTKEWASLEWVENSKNDMKITMAHPSPQNTPDHPHSVHNR